jgi:hypothetical protein
MRGDGLRKRDGRPKDAPLEAFVRTARCQAAVNAGPLPPPSAYKMSPKMLSRNEAAGPLPGWTGGRARFVTGQTDRKPEQKKRLSKNARRKLKRYGKRPGN